MSEFFVSKMGFNRPAIRRCLVEKIKFDMESYRILFLYRYNGESTFSLLESWEYEVENDYFDELINIKRQLQGN